MPDGREVSMKKFICAIVLALALAACVTVRHQDSVIGFATAPGCKSAVVNGKSGNLCVACALCPRGERCWYDGSAGFLEKCPR
jgi:hypothetical protein